MGRSKLAYDVMMRLWPLGKLTYWLGNRPLLRPLMRSQFRAEENDAVIIPVNETLRGAESVVLPYDLLAPLVERASACVILNHCLCRQGENCRTYPHEIGCIFLGDGAAGIAPRLGQAADVEEAMAHLQRAMEAGLTPLVVHAAFDAWIVGIPYHRMLAGRVLLLRLLLYDPPGLAAGTAGFLGYDCASTGSHGRGGRWMCWLRDVRRGMPRARDCAGGWSCAHWQTVQRLWSLRRRLSPGRYYLTRGRGSGCAGQPLCPHRAPHRDLVSALFGNHPVDR
jgi:hypothetical protein